MDNTFSQSEKLYCAIYPPEIASMFWKRDGSLSSAAFADPKGLSVERGAFRDEQSVVDSMVKKFTGHIVRIYVRDCFTIGAVIKYLPSKHNPYHSEIHGSNATALLSKQQRRYLAQKSINVT